ncbi:membrane-spanning 4-domains subfamily A member 15-like [Alligator sinensis]|uniref:Membrane-spanning 4-domains subfamily A member 15-like n=1 Tax=Alligator sinensis TaxID=38654 RepID=A0A3Q0GX34_ALLSI|nr:membrane-spanning 4-domains subfamily A member 15-like [Alligator sinensis]
MSMPGGRTTQVLVIMAPDSAGITPERQTMNSVNQPQQINRRVDRTMAIFLRAEPKTLGAIQILIGLIHMGFASVSIILIEAQTSYVSVITYSGYPFWGGLMFLISGSLSVAAELHHSTCLVKGSLGTNLVSAIFASCGTILLTVELIINGIFFSYMDQEPLFKAGKGIAATLLLVTLLELAIAVSVSHFGCQATCCRPKDDVVLMPYTVNTNSMVPSTPLTPPPSYDNMAYTKKEELGIEGLRRNEY